MSPDPEPPVTVVTGGTTGIGLAVVRRFLTAGHRVAWLGQNRARVAATQAALTAEFGADHVYAATVDLRDGAAIRGFAGDVATLWALPGILVANAGISPKRNGARVPFAEIGLDEWNDVLSVNLTGAMLCCQAVAPGMAARGFGRIILIGSIAARAMPRLAGASYVASKTALSGLARSLVAEYAGQGVTINTVAPGNILTDMLGDAASPANQAALARVPAGRLGMPDDIAAVVAFLASPEAAFVNGAVIDVNGGEYLPA